MDICCPSLAARPSTRNQEPATRNQFCCICPRLRSNSLNHPLTTMKRFVSLSLTAFVLWSPLATGAQEKQRFSSIDEALQAGGILSGRQGPRDVNWIEGGRRFSYTDRDPATNAPVIRAYDPPTGQSTVLFTTAGVTVPGTNQPFSYDSFQWAQDSKHLVFQTNFQPIYRRSGISDFYVYSIADKSLQTATNGARTG